MNREEKIKKIKDLEREARQLRNELDPEEQYEPFGRAGVGYNYYIINTEQPEPCVTELTEGEDYYDDQYFKNNNYFITRQQAEDALRKIKLTLRLKRLQNEFCCGYTPDWSDISTKYYIYYDYEDMKYQYGWTTTLAVVDSIYFPNKYIAEKVCDILNKEREEEVNVQ